MSSSDGDTAGQARAFYWLQYVEVGLANKRMMFEPHNLQHALLVITSGPLYCQQLLLMIHQPLTIINHH